MPEIRHPFVARFFDFVSSVASALFRIPLDPFEFLWGFAAAGWGVTVALDGDLFSALPKVYQYVAAPYGDITLTPQMIGGVFAGFGVLQMIGAFADENSRLPFLFGGVSLGFGPYGLKKVCAFGTLILWAALSHAFWKSGAVSGGWTYGFFAGVDGLILARLMLLAKVRELQGRGILPVRSVQTVAISAVPAVW